MTGGLLTLRVGVFAERLRLDVVPLLIGSFLAYLPTRVVGGRRMGPRMYAVTGRLGATPIVFNISEAVACAITADVATSVLAQHVGVVDPS